MEKRYNLVYSGLGHESYFLSLIHRQSLENPRIELVSSGFSKVYHVLDSTVKLSSDELSKPHVIRTYDNPFLQINSSNKRKIRKTIRALEEITEEDLEEIRKGAEK